MNAGLTAPDVTWGSYVAIATGTGEYAEKPVFMTDYSTQNADGSDRISNGRWWATPNPGPGSANDSEIIAEVGVACQGEPDSAKECTYTGDDVTRFMPESELTLSQDIGAGFAPPRSGPDSLFSSSFFSVTTEDGTLIRSGIFSSSQYFHWTGVRVGTGEFEGTLLLESGWAETVAGDPNSFEGVIQLSVLPTGS